MSALAGSSPCFSSHHPSRVPLCCVLAHFSWFRRGCSEEFLELKKNHGKEENRARDLFYALWIPDLFMKRVKVCIGVVV